MRRLAVLLPLFAVVACSEPAPAPPPPPAASPPSSAVPTSATPAPAPSSPTPGFPEAKDGTNVRACKDGACEILVTRKTTIPMAAHFGFKTVSFDPADRTWRFTYADGGSSSIAFLEPPYSGQWVAPYGEQGLNLRTVAFDKKRAVISISPYG
ncbi:hypothetical protein AB0M54_29175 [Actinoplanes sp. NPDC051470]|uniref:hypothetical protein n=1 Tax=Actinoplanes sp. NPDC051470 TaxID=3157224 RepID=UPI0034332B3A